MPRSGSVMDNVNVQFVYGSGPTTLVIGEIEEVMPSIESETKMRSGDAAPGPTHKRNVNQMRKVRLKGGDVGKLMTVPLGVFGTLSGVFLDEVNRSPTGAGSIAWELKSCSLDRVGPESRHNEFGAITAEFSAKWIVESNGSYTDPWTALEATGS